MARSKNTASADDIARLLRAEGTLNGAKYMHSDIELVIENYVELMVAVLRFTARPIESLLVRAAQLAFECDPEECRAFGQRIFQAFKFCQVKSTQMTSGKKLNPCVRRVCEQMLQSKGSSTEGTSSSSKAEGQDDSS